jgi:hypothetical protein
MLKIPFNKVNPLRVFSLLSGLTAVAFGEIAAFFDKHLGK